MLIRSAHAPRFLLLYGSLRERSYSKLLTFEAARLLLAMGGEVRIFDPAGLPLPDGAPETHPKVQELRDAATWAEGMVWTSPERHGAMTGVLKAQIDWIPLSVGAVRPTQGKTLAVMEVSGGSQSFNAVNQMRVLGRWMRMITIPHQSSVAKAFQEFDEAGRMKPPAFYERVVDVMEELMKFTLLTRDVAPYLVDRYSERRETAEALSRRVNQRGSDAAPGHQRSAPFSIRRRFIFSDQQDGSATRAVPSWQGTARQAAQAKRCSTVPKSNRRFNKCCTWPRSRCPYFLKPEA